MKPGRMKRECKQAPHRHSGAGRAPAIVDTVQDRFIGCQNFWGPAPSQVRVTQGDAENLQGPLGMTIDANADGTTCRAPWNWPRAVPAGSAPTRWWDVSLSKDGEVVGRGYHQRFGGPHAEVHALYEAGDRAREAVLYVTLEPCCHTGKTPPCVDAILQAQVGRVVVGHAGSQSTG